MAKTRVIALANQKGGVAKTTTTANLAYTLARKGYDVLAIDFDSQASLTNYLNIGLEEEERYYGIYDLLLCQLRDIYEEEDEVLCKYDASTDEGFEALFRLCLARPTYLARKRMTVDGKYRTVDVEEEFGFDLLPSHLMLSDYELELSTSSDRSMPPAFRLYNTIQRITAIHEYDYILIDTGPSLGILSMNAVCAATSGILIPTNLDLMSTRGVASLIDRIANIQEAMLDNGEPVRHMGVIGIILNLYSTRRSVDVALEKHLEKYYPFKVFDTTIPESVDAKKAVLAGLALVQVNAKAAARYSDLADELIQTLEKMEEEGQKILYLGKPVSEDQAIEEEVLSYEQ